MNSRNVLRTCKLHVLTKLSPSFHPLCIERFLHWAQGAFTKDGATAPVRMKMKNTVRMTVITLALVVMALSPAYAQKTSATVNIPFTFTVDDVRMPAGEYTISSPSERVVTLQHMGGLEAKTTMTNNGSFTKSDGRAKLVFHSTATRISWRLPGCRTPTTPASSMPRRMRSR